MNYHPYSQSVVMKTILTKYIFFRLYIFSLIIATMTLTEATLRLKDYSHADYIPIVDGDVTIWDSYTYLGHTTNLTSFETYIDKTWKLINYPKTI